MPQDIPTKNPNLTLTTAGVALGMFLAALDTTIVGTAMPTVIGSLGGLALYTWVFSTYLLSSTVATPIFGKLSDLYGRRNFFVIGIVIFIAASALCGLSQSIGQLIAFRTLQGIGGGAIFALTFTIIGVVYGPERRGRMQGLMASIWAISSIVGPLTGGFIVDYLDWRWAFFVNVPLGFLAVGLLMAGFHEERRPEGYKPVIDYAGAVLLAAGVTSFLLALLEGARRGWASPEILFLLAVFAVSAVAFIGVERRAPEPVLPLWLFQSSSVGLPNLLNFLSGMALFGAIAFIPLFIQGVLGGSATSAGSVLTPLSLGWPLGSLVGGYLMARVGHKRLITTGFLLMSAGFYLLTALSVRSDVLPAMRDTFLLGLGMGLVAPTLIVVIQNSVRVSEMGVASASVQFFRTIGGALGVSVMGLVMGAVLTGELDGLESRVGSGAGSVPDPQALLQPGGLSAVPADLLAPLRGALHTSLDAVFWIGLGLAVLGFLFSLGMRSSQASPR